MKTRIKLIKDEYDLYYPLEYGYGKARVFLQPQPFRETTYNGELKELYPNMTIVS